MCPRLLLAFAILAVGCKDKPSKQAAEGSSAVAADEPAPTPAPLRKRRQVPGEHVGAL